MEFEMVERSQRPEDGYRLACVEDVIKNAEMIREKEIFTEQRTVRLLDGWVNRHLRPEVGFRKHMDYMLVAREGYTGRGDMLRKHLYYRISLSDEGREAALLLSCDDENREVIYWLLTQIINHEVELDRLKNSFRDTFPEKMRTGYLQVVDGLLELAARVAKNEITDWKTELHSARELQSVADQLISAELIFKGCYSAQKTHGKGKSPCVQSEKVEDDTANVDLRCLLKEALEKGYTGMVYGLLELGSDLAPRPEIVHGSDGKTLLHYAAELRDHEKALNIIKLVVERYGGEEFLTKRYGGEEYGTTVLHVASLFGHGNLIDYLVNKDLYPKGSLYQVRDEYSQNPLHYAAKGNHGNEEIVDKLVEQDYRTLVSGDEKGKTPLHVASEEGHRKIVRKLLSKSTDAKDYVLRTDSFGQTALHKAASRGHTRIVRVLLKTMEGYTPDWDDAGRTSLHFAVLLEGEDSAKEITTMLLDNCRDEKDKYLLLCSPAFGIGNVMQSAKRNKHSLGETRMKIQESLIKKMGFADMYWTTRWTTHYATDFRARALRSLSLEYFGAGSGFVDKAVRMADRFREQSEWDETLCRQFLETITALPEDLRQHEFSTSRYFGAWLDACAHRQRLDKYGKIKEFFERLKESYKNGDLYNASSIDTLVKKLVEALRNEGFDNPTTIDTLGRANFAAGVAALFLSPHVKSPITVGILGNWGMGKSSVMLQIEKLMLQTASFPHLLPPESLPDGAEIVPNKNCKKLFKMICQEVKLEGDAQVASLASKLYRSKFHGILKSLASMDRSSMFRMYDHDKDSFSKYSGGGHMNIMTVFYNAWHYRDEHEAWAGLAVEITKEIESTMTAAQWLSTCWRYASTRERESFYLQLILPSLIAIIVAVGVVVVAWILLSTSHNINKMLSGFIRYGSIPATFVGIAWVVMKSAFSILKPVSSQMVGYMRFPDHSARLGYQQKVIDDINFLKDEIGREPKLFCSLIANTWFGLCQNNVPGTAIPKVRPASRENLRIVVFVDDLDRCQDTVILKVLSAIHLVLAACQIDVVLGIDSKMIERTVRKEFKDIGESDEIKEDLTENYMRKIIQVPLVLSDRSDLALELDRLPNRIPREEEDPPSDDDAPQETGGSHDAPQETGGSHVSAADSGECGVNIEGEDPATMTRHNTSLKIKMCGLVYSTIHYMNEKICGLMYKTISSCIQKKFAWDSGPQWNSEALPWSGEELAGQKLKFTYSFQERQAFMSLSELAKNYRRTPREFKEYENYHFVARNVLSKDPNVRLMQDWQSELIVWLFCCWQWRRQINIIIQNWDELVEATVSNVRQSKARRGKYGPSLAEIIDYYIDKKLPSRQNSVYENVLLQIGSTISVEDRLRKVLEAAGYVQDRELKMQQVDWTNIKKLWKQQKQQEAWLRSIKGAREKEKEEQKAWQSLREALKEQDVSMECIQYFQGFRFHCNTGHLSWNPEWYQERL